MKNFFLIIYFIIPCVSYPALQPDTSAETEHLQIRRETWKIRQKLNVYDDISKLQNISAFTIIGLILGKKQIEEKLETIVHYCDKAAAGYVRANPLDDAKKLLQEAWQETDAYQIQTLPVLLGAFRNLKEEHRQLQENYKHLIKVNKSRKAKL